MATKGLLVPASCFHGGASGDRHARATADSTATHFEDIDILCRYLILDFIDQLRYSAHVSLGRVTRIWRVQTSDHFLRVFILETWVDWTSVFELLDLKFWLLEIWRWFEFFCWVIIQMYCIRCEEAGSDFSCLLNSSSCSEFLKDFVFPWCLKLPSTSIDVWCWSV